MSDEGSRIGRGSIQFGIAGAIVAVSHFYWLGDVPNEIVAAETTLVGVAVMVAMNLLERARMLPKLWRS